MNCRKVGQAAEDRRRMASGVAVPILQRLKGFHSDVAVVGVLVHGDSRF